MYTATFVVLISSIHFYTQTCKDFCYIVESPDDGAYLQTDVAALTTLFDDLILNIGKSNII